MSPNVDVFTTKININAELKRLKILLIEIKVGSYLKNGMLNYV